MFAERLLEERIALPCRYSDSGCTEELLSRDLARHERDCPHRPTKCPHRGCPISTSHARDGILYWRMLIVIMLSFLNVQDVRNDNVLFRSAVHAAGCVFRATECPMEGCNAQVIYKVRK